MNLQSWVFDIAQGNYSIDLGDSNAPCKTVSQVAIQDDLHLDYGSDQGSLDLREKISELYSATSAEILVTHGAQEGLFLNYLYLLKPGDEVILLTPGWPQAYEAPKKLGARPIPITYLENGGLNLKALRESITHKTKAIVINSPSNPTTAELTASDFRALRDVIQGKDITVIFDDEYSVDLQKSYANQCPNSVSVSSLSKIYGLPGLRVGWVKADPDHIQSLRALKHLTTISNSVHCEKMALSALNNKAAYQAQYQEMWETGREILQTWAAQHPECFTQLHISQAPFAWIQLAPTIQAVDFCKTILKEKSILLMPADVFDATQHIRLTFVRDKQELTIALAHISEVIASYLNPHKEHQLESEFC